jgi:hypothetical protein
MSHVGHEHEQLLLAADGKAYALRGIVGHNEVLDIKIFRDGIPHASLKILTAGAHPVAGEGVPEQGFMKRGCGPNRRTHTLAEGTQGTDVVPVVMGYQDGRYILIPKMQELQFLLDTADTYAGINQDTGTGAE